MHNNLTAKAGLSQLIIIDTQTRLITAMSQDALLPAIKNISILAQAAALLAVPAIVTEQYSKGLGHTLPELLALLPNIRPVEKIAFSCVAALHHCSHEQKKGQRLRRGNGQNVSQAALWNQDRIEILGDRRANACA